MGHDVESVINDGEKRILVDLLFDLAAGDSASGNSSYEAQLEYFIPLIIPDYFSVEELLEYGQKYRMSSRYMFPGKPERIKNRGLLIKLFSSFAVINEMATCESYEIISDSMKLRECILSKFNLSNEVDKITFNKEIIYLTKRYSENLSKDKYEIFLSIFDSISDIFYETYSKVSTYVTGDSNVLNKGEFLNILEVYNINSYEATKFHLVIDAIAETVVTKNECLEYEEEFKKEWENRFPKLKYNEALGEYIQSNEEVDKNNYI